MNARAELQCSLNPTGDLRKDNTGVRSNHPYGADYNHEDDRQHDRVFGNVLPICIPAKSD